MTELYQHFDGLYIFFFQTSRYSGKAWQNKKLATPKGYVLQANAINYDFQC